MLESKTLRALGPSAQRFEDEGRLSVETRLAVGFAFTSREK
jgi:hypothetical protein